jgi:LacI family transcriptional regulator
MKDESKEKVVTIYQVAKEANVSLATVSRVINGKSNVNEETAKMVQETIDRLGYVPSVLARGLATSITTTIGIVLPSPNYSYINSIMSGMMDVCKIYGYSPSIFTFEDVEDSERAIESVLASRVEGIVVFNSQLTPKDVKRLSNRNLPIVIIGEDELYQKNGVVKIDYKTALEEFVKLQIKNNIKKIIFLNDSNKDWLLTNNLIARVRTLLEKTNIVFEVLEIDDSYNSIYPHFKEKFSKQKPNHELYITVRDTLAGAIVNAGLDLGFKVPADFEVMGIIGTKRSITTRPMISSIDVDLYEVGSIAMRMLTKILKRNLSSREFEFKTDYNKRQTTKV